MSDFLPTLSTVLTSPIWFLAIAIFGVIYYFQNVVTTIQDAPKNVECKKCSEKIHAYFPNTKFCDACFHELRDYMNDLTAQLEVARKEVADLKDDKLKLEGYEKAMVACQGLIDLKQKYPKHGLSMSDNLPTVLEYAISESNELKAKITKGEGQ
ncbi:MAG: hypothetical protein QNL04_09665 [SAR324 cluster bacterium]|nr:hypothetical protein [SAR324 cluster bacterium]